ncbi:MAG: hypothetical protein MI725_06510, partial [Pirellulales bacterium]|nr:hypothetical protein [Pirellulales bacterium]
MIDLRQAAGAAIVVFSVLVAVFGGSAAAAVSFQPVVIRGDDAPGLPGIKFQAFSNVPYINHQGEVAFYGSLENAGAGDFAIWAGIQGDLDLVAREGDLAPGAGGAHYTTSSGFSLRGIADNRQTLFRGFLDLNDPGITLANDEAYWFGVSGAVGRVVAEDDPKPTSPYLNQSGLPGVRFDAAGNLGYSRIDAYYGAPGTVGQVNLLNQPAPGAGDD